MIKENSTHDMDQMFMQQAFREAQQAADEDEVPVGAVIIQDGKIIAKAHNQIERLKDPTAHAEMIAITQATHTLGSKWLYNCTMYVTLEPCSMCAGALVLARVERLVIAALDPKSGACGSVFNIAESHKLNHRLKVEQGPLAQESATILQNFFKKKRSRGDVSYS